MSQEDSKTQNVGAVPEAQVRAGRGFSIIWVVPILALLIGGWLAYKAMSEKGPTISIKFENADGLVAGKTVIKFKDVEIGKVSTIDLIDDLSGVIVTAEMRSGSEAYLTDKAQFWVVRARVAAGEISGLGTLFSGAYIGCDPSSEGNSLRNFTGLEKPPVLTADLPGAHFTLRSETLGSLDVGSPVIYRGITVGKIVEYDFDDGADSVLMKIFVNAPYQNNIYENTKFWNASGIDFSMDSSGVKMDTQSLVSIMLGGIAFDTTTDAPSKGKAQEDSEFQLHATYEQSQEVTYDVKNYYLLYFDESVRGLASGAPVEIRGIKIGEVVSVELEYDINIQNFRIPVLVVIEPERMSSMVTAEGAELTGEKMDAEIGEEMALHKRGIFHSTSLVEKGLRAQLKTGNLLTGQLYVDLDFHPDAAPAEITKEDGYMVFPTISDPFDRILRRVDNILKQFEEVKVADISKDLQGAVKDMQSVLKDFRSISQKINAETIPQINKVTIPKLNASLSELDKTLEGVSQTLGPDSALSYNSRKVTDELYLTIRSLRSLLDYLERDPQALILGKEGDKK